MCNRCFCSSPRNFIPLNIESPGQVSKKRKIPSSFPAKTPFLWISISFELIVWFYPSGWLWRQAALIFLAELHISWIPTLISSLLFFFVGCSLWGSRFREFSFTSFHYFIQWMILVLNGLRVWHGYSSLQSKLVKQSSIRSPVQTSIRVSSQTVNP